MHVVHLLANIALVVAAAGCVTFVVLYQALTEGGWRHSAVGRNVMAFMAAAGLLLTVAVARAFVDFLDSYLDVVRLGSFTLVAVIVWQRVALLIREQTQKDPDPPGPSDRRPPNA